MADPTRFEAPIADDSAEELPEDDAKYERSTISFPYGDLSEAETVTRALLDRGGGRGSYSQLAAWLGHDTVRSGGFRLKVATAKHFGLIETDGSTAQITDLGRDVLNPDRQRTARVQAFLHVPLYGAIFEAYDGGLLPKDIGLENQMQTLGVASKQVKKARQAMVRSAETAGFFESGKDRLVRPPGAIPEAKPSVPPAAEQKNNTGGSGGGSEDGSTKVVKLRSTGQITFAVSVDLVTLSKDDRTFVFDLIDKLNDYEQSTAPKQLAAGTVAPLARQEPISADQEAV